MNNVCAHEHDMAWYRVAPADMDIDNLAMDHLNIHNMDLDNLDTDNMDILYKT